MNNNQLSLFSQEDLDKMKSSHRDIENIEVNNKPKQPRSRLYSNTVDRKTKQIYRRAFSETQLLDLVQVLEPDCIYNFITGGDVDALSYLKLVLRSQNLDYCFFSTWCMATEDIYQIKDWLESGKIKKMDAFVGEIFPGTYLMQYRLLKPIIEKSGGRVAVFRNHSKVFAGYGDKFHFGIQTSANVNTNPRTEQGCIQTTKELYEFYYEYFSGIKSFDRD